MKRHPENGFGRERSSRDLSGEQAYNAPASLGPEQVQALRKRFALPDIANRYLNKKLFTQ